MSEYGVFISWFLIQRNSSIFQSSYEVFYPLKYVYLQISYHVISTKLTDPIGQSTIEHVNYQVKIYFAV